MTTKTITEWLSRGIIASMMDPSIALIESANIDGRVETFAFVNGMPMPYETFSMLMLFRMAPKATSQIWLRQGVCQFHGGKLPQYHTERLVRLVPNASLLPAKHRDNAESGVGHAAWCAVRDLYDLAAYGDGSKDASAAFTDFGAMMERIDESYISSLIDPPMLSVETFDFDDDGLVTKQFADDGFDGLFKPIRPDHSCIL